MSDCWTAPSQHRRHHQHYRLTALSRVTLDGQHRLLIPWRETSAGRSCLGRTINDDTLPAGGSDPFRRFSLRRLPFSRSTPRRQARRLCEPDNQPSNENTIPASETHARDWRPVGTLWLEGDEGRRSKVPRRRCRWAVSKKRMWLLCVCWRWKGEGVVGERGRGSQEEVEEKSRRRTRSRRAGRKNDDLKLTARQDLPSPRSTFLLS